jgi:hypothetical protein
MTNSSIDNDTTKTGHGQGVFSSECPALLAEHFRHLHDGSGISTEVIRERGYESVMGTKRLSDLGFSKPQQRTPGILMPIWSPTGRNTNYQYRPDVPRINRDGKPIKYETPRGTSVCLDIPPRCRSQIGDPGIPLFTTEGIKKGDSLASHGACAASLMGVWGFVGQNVQGGITTLAEWREIALNGRHVFIAYDSDIVLKRQVQQALNLLSDLLARRGADVWVIYLPSPDGRKVGIDDFLVTHTLDDAIRLARRPEAGAKLRGGYRVEDGRICRVWIERGGIEHAEPLCNFVAEVTEDVTRDDGIDQEHYFKIAGRLAGGCALPAVQVPASSFSALSWVVGNWGVQAVIAAGQSRKDQLREAIQLMSLNSAKRTVYTHSGWRNINGRWVFLSADTAGVDVELPEGLKLYRLPDKCQNPKMAMGCSLRFLGIASIDITAPLLAAVYTAPLSEALPMSMMLFLVGITGNLKTTLACLAISHFGGPFDRKSVPATFISTDNYLERLTSQAKDVLLLIDDYFPQATEAEARQQEQRAQRLIRSQTSHSGRGRLRPDASARPSYAPRGLIIATGELLPTGQSTAARMLVVDISRDDVNLQELSAAQSECSHYPEAMRSYTDWLAPQLDKLKAELPGEFTRLRDSLRQRYSHLNVAEMIAQLCVGWDLMLEHATVVGAIDEHQRDTLLSEGFEALTRLGEKQAARVLAERPSVRFIDTLKNLFAQKRAYLRDKDTGEEPGNYQAWGWERRETDGGSMASVSAGAELLGWVDDDEGYVYLLSEASYKAVARFARDQGQPLTVTKKSLHMQLRREGILVPLNDENIIVKKIGPTSHRVIQLNAQAFD